MPEQKPPATTPVTDQKKDQKKSSKALYKIGQAFKSPTTVGIIVTFFFVYVTHTFYVIRRQNEGERIFNHPIRNFFHSTIEWIDLKNADARLLLRGEESPSDSVALLTIDDRTIEQIGRWPWSREKIAFVVEEMMKYGASSIGFDIVFAEPQIEGTELALNHFQKQFPNMPPQYLKAIEDEKKNFQPDRTLAETLSKYSDKLVLGAFNEEKTEGFIPFQDYCRNEAFMKTNADKFIKLNATFIVDDQADPFVDLEFSKIFDVIFALQDKHTQENALKEVFHKESLENLDGREKAQFEFMRTEAYMNFCNTWLTESDPYFKIPEIQEIYKEVFWKSPLLKDLPLEDAKEVFKKTVKPMPITQYSRWTINTDQIQENMSYTASFNAEQDPDGTVRRASMFFRTGNRIGTSFIPSLALQTYLLGTGYRALIEINTDPKNPEQKIIKKFEIINPNTDPETVVTQVPIDEIGRMKINYSGGKAMYPYLPAKELFNGKETAEIYQSEFDPHLGMWQIVSRTVKKAEFIKNKSFIFGLTAIGVYDLRVTPFEKNYPGPETHVSVLGNLFDQNFIHLDPYEEDMMVWAILAFGILLSIAISKTTAIPGFLITFGSIATIIGLDQLLLKKGIVTTMTLPACLVVILYVVLFFYKYLTEERKKKHLKSTFSKYVSPAIVEEILRDPENVELGGRKQSLTVFFSDLRNFTTISEKLQATELSDVLNLYLTPMTNLVFENKGTLDKYIGDAVMAFFGAPIAFPDNAKWACRCALASLAKLQDIRNEIDSKFPGKNIPIEIGIGINTADVSVGNMGSDIVRSYTVMGDGVNLASRLEGITKEYGIKIVISEFTYAEVKDTFGCRELDWVRVKGKLKPVRIFELICEGKPQGKKEKVVEHFGRGFDLYHQKDFNGAKSEFLKALEFESEDPPSKLYVERCDDYIAEPPDENWDGVYVMKTK